VTLAGLFLTTAAGAVVTVDNPQTPPSGPIVWNDAPAPGASSATPDKNGIIWDTPGAPAVAPPSSNSTVTSPVAPNASAPTKRESIIWDTPAQTGTGAPGAPKTLVPPPSTAGAQANGDCREFQQTIVIDGRAQPAHGTACRQADGSWRVTR
jgi:hypothetical protein